ncbi:unnamed protein product [Paramecium primaurelia]|uniref:Uncharacterized protein n=1 Tax=Paramecium primaurelia TaxID=5886 RepID=A0A8S1L3G9_PARPR|nr:unnamed protein product [Paramecium primaurelia]
MHHIQPKDYRITLTNGQTKVINSTSLQLKQKVSKIDNTVPYEFMMLVNDKNNYVFQCSQDYDRQNKNSELYNLKVMDMQLVYLENVQLKARCQEYENQINQLSQQILETSNNYKDEITKNQNLQNLLYEINIKVQELEQMQEENTQSQIIGQKNVDEKIQQKNKVLQQKEEQIKKLNEEITNHLNTIQILKDKLQKKDEQLKLKNQELEQIKLDQNSKNQELQNQINQITHLQNSNSNLQIQNTELQNYIKNQIGNLEQDKGNLQQQSYYYYQNSLDLTQQLSDIKITLEQKDLQIKKLQIDMKIQKENYESLKQKKDDEDQIYKRSLERQQSQHSTEISDLKSQIFNLNSFLKNNQQEINDQEKQIKDLKRKIKDQDLMNFCAEILPTRSSFYEGRPTLRSTQFR